MTILSNRGWISRSGVERSSRDMYGVLSTPGVKIDGHDVQGWTYPDSVPFIDSHLDRDGVTAVIGRVYPRLDSDRLVGRLSFASASVNERAETAYQLCANGFIDALSVGFTPIEYAFANEYGRPAGSLDIKLAKLNEVSVCAVGVDDDAKILGRALRAQQRGHSTREDRLAIARALQRRGHRNQLLSSERRLYERYQILRTGYGHDVEQAALALHVQPHRLREIIARGLSGP